MLENHLAIPVSRSKTSDGINEIQITFEVSKGNFALRNEKVVLILETVLLAQRKVIESLANEIKRLNKNGVEPKHFASPDKTDTSWACYWLV